MTPLEEILLCFVAYLHCILASMCLVKAIKAKDDKWHLLVFLGGTSVFIAMTLFALLVVYLKGNL